MNGLGSLAELPPLEHVGIVVLDFDDAVGNFQRRWGARITGISDITLTDALSRPLGRDLFQTWRDPLGCIPA
jgi:hypothetical protein